MVKVLVLGTLKPGSWDKVRPLYKELTEETRKEKGCIEYTLYVDPKDDHSCFTMETWEDEAAFEAHKVSDHVKRIGPQIGEMRVAPAQIIVLKEAEL